MKKKTRKKPKLSKAERARRSRQAKKNFKTKKRSVGKVTKRRRKKTQAMGMLKGVSSFAGPVIYGAIREKLSSMIANSAIGQKLPQSEYTGEVTLLVINEIAKKAFGINRIPVVGAVSRSLKIIELASIGTQLAKDFLNR